MSHPDDNLERLTAEYRHRARAYPITAHILNRIAREPNGQQHYTFKYGKFYVTTWYETHCKPPRWQASVTILEEVGELEFGAAKEALLAVESWTNEDHAQAKDLLGHALGPEIVKDSQTVHSHKGTFSVHWLVEDVKGEQHGHSNIILAH